MEEEPRKFFSTEDSPILSRGEERKTDILRRPKAVEEAIRRAETYAREAGVPLTLERVAACLGVNREVIRRLAEQENPADNCERRVCEALRGVYLRCNADLIESLMTKNNSGTAMLARSNFGYGEETAVQGEPVVFVGERDLAP